MPGLFSGPPLPPAELAASEANTIYAAIVVVTLIATAGVILRFVSRARSNTKLAWDDYTIVAALVFLYGLNVLTIISVALWGLGKHVQAVPVSKIPSFQKAGLANFIIYFTTCATIKASLLLLYYRLFKISKRFRLALTIAAIIVFCWFISLIFASLFQCVPLQAFWDPRIRDARCYSVITFAVASGITNLLTDVMVLAVPMPMVWTLHTNKTQKVTLTGIFLLGSFVCAVSVVRIVTLAKADFDDPTWRLKNVFIWTSLEPSIGILSACLPTMRPLFGRFLNLSTRTAVTPKGNTRGSGKRPVNAPKSVGPITPAMEGFARMDEEAMDRHAANAPTVGVIAWRGDGSVAKGSSDAVRLHRMDYKQVPKPQNRRIGFGQDGW